MPSKREKQLKYLLLFSISVLLSSCAQGYDRYMEEGRKFQESKEYEKAKKSFHYAVFEGRKDKKSPDKLIKAISSEIECCNSLNISDDAISLSDEAANVYLKAGFVEKSALMRKQAGDLSQKAGNSIAADTYYDQGLADLKAARKGRSNVEASILISKGEILMQKKQYKQAANLMQKACNMMDKLPDPDKHAESVALNKLSFIYDQLNMENEAVECSERAKKIEVTGIGARVENLGEMVPKFK
jgi:tetratricopeptide (TPR) repeat protein